MTILYAIFFCIFAKNREIEHDLEFEIKHKRKLVAIKDIEANDILENGKNYGIYRQSRITDYKKYQHYIHPHEYLSINLKKIKRKKFAGQIITKEDFTDAF